MKPIPMMCQSHRHWSDLVQYMATERSRPHPWLNRFFHNSQPPARIHSDRKCHMRIPDQKLNFKSRWSIKRPHLSYHNSKSLKTSCTTQMKILNHTCGTYWTTGMTTLIQNSLIGSSTKQRYWKGWLACRQRRLSPTLKKCLKRRTPRVSYSTTLKLSKTIQQR